MSSTDITAWGSDVPVSMPAPIDEGDIIIDFGSHVFTPDGMKIYFSRAVREDIVSAAYLPIDRGDA